MLKLDLSSFFGCKQKSLIKPIHPLLSWRNISPFLPSGQHGTFFPFYTLLHIIILIHRPIQTLGDVYETKAYHHWCLVTVIVEEDQNKYSGQVIPSIYLTDLRICINLIHTYFLNKILNSIWIWEPWVPLAVAHNTTQPPWMSNSFCT